MTNVYYGLRSKQKETFDACIKEKFGIISDTCGSGKSHVEFELICKTITDNLYKKAFIVLAAHRLDLIDQHLDNFADYVESYHPELIGKFNQFEISSANRSDKKIVNTTRINEIKAQIIGATMPTIITVCYHSLSRLYNSFYGSKYNVSLMICDEGHYGMSSDVREMEEKIDEEKLFGKYACINFCDSFLVFSATPFKQTMVKTIYGHEMKVIHDYTYAEAVADGIVLPVHSNFYTGNYCEKTINGMVETAYEFLKKDFNKTSAKLLVCGTGLENNQLLFNSLIKKYKKEIENGDLAIAKIGSEGLTEDDERIPSCEWLDKDQMMRFGKENGLCAMDYGYKLCPADDRKNKKMVFKNMHDWIDPSKHNGKHNNIIIIHCQMLGVGVDVPNINGVCILGNKESADLYQSIMRPCRIAKFDRGVDESARLENHFDVFIHTPADVQEAIKDFMNRLINIGAMSLIDALVLNSVTGSHEKENEETAKAKKLFEKMKAFAKVNEECEMIFNLTDFMSGLAKYNELITTYPDEKETIDNMFNKFIRKIQH